MLSKRLLVHSIKLLCIVERPNKTNKLKVFFARSIFLVSMIEPDFNLQLSPKLLKWQYFKCEQIQSQALRPSHFIGRKGLLSR